MFYDNFLGGERMKNRKIWVMLVGLFIVLMNGFMGIIFIFVEENEVS